MSHQEDIRPREVANLDLLLTPLNTTYNEVEDALNDRNNYGPYLVNVRDKSSVAKAMEEFFGPTLPTKKKPLEKLRGKPFPPKTKQAIEEFLAGLEFGNPNILTWEVLPNGKILFPTKKNESKSKTKKVIKQVLGSAGLEYKLEDYENLAEVNRMKRLAGLK